MKIKGFIKNTFIEYPGKIASIIFVSGCNFRCPFCFNPELIFESEDMKDVEEKEVLDFLDKQKKWIDALVVSGGEPTLQKDLPEFLAKVKKNGLPTRIYTNGSNPKILKELVERKLIDSIAMDIKGPLTEEAYDKLSGTKGMLANVKESISLIMSSGIDYEFRTTIVPGMISEKDVEDIAKYIKGAKLFIVQRFMPANTLDVKLRKLCTQTDEEMQKLASVAGRHVQNVSAR
jgi:pyruvate formate lyase activating enzyme